MSLDAPAAAPGSRRIIYIALALYLAAVAFATLTPRPIGPMLTGPWCLLCGELGGVDILQNLILFAPLGVLLAMAGATTRTAALRAFLISLTIEGLQYSIISGRDASVSDVLTNTLGATVGAWLTANRRAWLVPDAARSRPLAIAWSTAMIATLAAMAVALQPSVPRFDAYVQFMPVRTFWDTFAGRLLDARLEERPLASGLMDASDPRIGALRHGRYSAEMAVSGAQRTNRFAPVLRIGNRQGEMFFLGQRHLDAVFRPRLRASDAGLRSPFFAVRDGLAANQTEVRVRGEMTKGSVGMRVTTGVMVQERHIALSPSLGWALLIPFEVALAGGELMLGALWLALLAAPAGYWSGLWLAEPSRGRMRPALTASLAPLLFTGGLAAASRISGSDGVHVEEVAGIVTGHLIGMAIAMLVRHRQGQ